MMLNQFASEDLNNEQMLDIEHFFVDDSYSQKAYKEPEPLRKTQDYISSLEKTIFELKMKLHFVGNFEPSSLAVIELKETNERLFEALKKKDELVNEAIQEVSKLEIAGLETDKLLALVREELAGANDKLEQNNSVLRVALDNVEYYKKLTESYQSSISQKDQPVRVSVSDDEKTEDQEQDDDSDLLKERLKEFESIAQEATQELVLLHDQLQHQQEQIDAWENNEKESVSMGVQTDDDTSLNMATGVSITTQTANDAALIDNITQTINISKNAITTYCQTESYDSQTRNISCQTDQLAIPKQFIDSPKRDDAEHNRQRYILELKVRNALLVRLNQNLNVKMGVTDDCPLDTFSALKKVLVEKMKRLRDQRVLDEEIKGYKEKSEVLISKLDNRESTHDKERQAIFTRVNELLQEKRKLENEIQNQPKQDADLQHQYIKSIGKVEDYKFKMEKLEVKVKFALSHLQKYSDTMDLNLINIIRQILEMN